MEKQPVVKPELMRECRVAVGAAMLANAGPLNEDELERLTREAMHRACALWYEIVDQEQGEKPID